MEVYNKSLCQPRELLVEILQEYPDEVEHIFIPSCVVLTRCAGCCNDEMLQCTPTSTYNVTMEVSNVIWSSNTCVFILFFLLWQLCQRRICLYPKYGHLFSLFLPKRQAKKVHRLYKCLSDQPRALMVLSIKKPLQPVQVHIAQRLLRCDLWALNPIVACKSCAFGSIRICLFYYITTLTLTWGTMKDTGYLEIRHTNVYFLFFSFFYRLKELIPGGKKMIFSWVLQNTAHASVGKKPWTHTHTHTHIHTKHSQTSLQANQRAFVEQSGSWPSTPCEVIVWSFHLTHSPDVYHLNPYLIFASFTSLILKRPEQVWTHHSRHSQCCLHSSWFHRVQCPLKHCLQLRQGDRSSVHSLDIGLWDKCYKVAFCILLGQYGAAKTALYYCSNDVHCRFCPSQTLPCENYPSFCHVCKGSASVETRYIWLLFRGFYSVLYLDVALS